MDRQTFEKTVQQYCTEMLKMAARSRFPDEAEHQDAQSARQTSAQPVAIPANAVESAAPPQESLSEAERIEIQSQTAGEAGNQALDINPPESGEGQDSLQPIDNELQSYEEFMAENTRTGELRVQAESGRRAFPVPGAQVTVSKNFTDGMRIFATGVTDENGILEGIFLPAPSRTISQAPSDTVPYSAYQITVTHPGFQGEQFIQVPIFDGIKSIQPVRFVPLQPNVN